MLRRRVLPSRDPPVRVDAATTRRLGPRRRGRGSFSAV